MSNVQDLTTQQLELLKCLNPLEYAFTQRETAILMGLSERQVRRIFRQLKIKFPEAMEKFDKIKKKTNKLCRRVNKPWRIEPKWFNTNTIKGLKIREIW